MRTVSSLVEKKGISTPGVESTPADQGGAGGDPKALRLWHRPYVWLGLLIAFWIANNALWAFWDTSPPKYDPCFYLLVSVKQLAVIRGPWQQIAQLIHISVIGRPPLYTLVTQPVYLLAGTSEDLATVATNAVFIPVLLISVYALGKRLFNSRTGLLAATLVAAYPTLTLFSRRYRPQFAAVAMIALGAYLLLRTEDFRNRRHAVLLGLATGLGMLTSAYVMFALLGLGVWVAFRSLHLASKVSRREGQREALLKVISNIVLSLAIALALSLPWYLYHVENISAVLQYTQESRKFAPIKHVYSLRAFLWYCMNMHRTVSVFLVVPFVIGVLTALVRPRARSMTLLWWFASAYLPLSLLATKTPMHATILLPSVALLSSFWVFQLRHKVLRIVVVVLLVLASGCLFLETAWELFWPSEEPYRFGVMTAPPLHENWHVEDILTLVDEDSQSEATSLLVVADISRFSPANLKYEARRTGFGGAISSCRYAEPKDLLNAPYTIVLLRGGGKGMTRVWGVTPCHTWSDLLRTPPHSFMANHSLLGTFPLPDESEARVYKLTGPVSSAETVRLLGEILGLNPHDQKTKEAFLGAIEHPLQISLGGVVTPLGYEINPTTVQPGGTIAMTIWWESASPMDRDYTAFIHLVDRDGRIWAQQDRLLRHDDRPTSAWLVGEIVEESHQLVLPADTPAGEYTVKLGTYYWETGERLPVWDEHGQRLADDAILLESITVTE